MRIWVGFSSNPDGSSPDGPRTARLSPNHGRVPPRLAPAGFAPVEGISVNVIDRRETLPAACARVTVRMGILVVMPGLTDPAQVGGVACRTEDAWRLLARHNRTLCR